MRLFKEKGTYVYVFCVYAINALFLVSHAMKKSAPTHKSPLLFIVIPQVIGMLLLAVVASFSTRRTSNALEKCILILTSIICVLFVASVFSTLGYDVPRFLVSYSAFVVVSCAAALLAGWRTVEIVMTGGPGS
jgi:hypothetical protein